MDPPYNQRLREGRTAQPAPPTLRLPFDRRSPSIEGTLQVSPPGDKHSGNFYLTVSVVALLLLAATVFSLMGLVAEMVHRIDYLFVHFAR